MKRLLHRARVLIARGRSEIWGPEALERHDGRGQLYSAVRIVTITVKGLEENKAASRAAALSFSSLLGLGPVVALAMLVAGFMLNDQDPHLAVNTLNRVISFVAPQIVEYERVTGERPPPPRESRSDVLAALPQTQPDTSTADRPDADSAAVPAAIRPELEELIEGFVTSSRSGAVGAIGALTLIIIVLQLFTSIESAFNDIWGVQRGRSWLMRIVFYWTILTLGSVLFFAALTGLSAGAFFNTFAERIPFGPELLQFLALLLPAGSVVLLVVVLATFYRTIPNTHVTWGASLIGALVVAVLLVANNTLAFLYFKRVVLSKSLYGSLGILPILMFGLYVFWFFVLLGGQVSYAVQNSRYRNSQAAWQNLNVRVREHISLLVLLAVCRRFHACLPPCSASQLGDLLQVPTQLLNASLTRLVRMKLLTPIPSDSKATDTDDFYQPARPLSRITLARFKQLDDECSIDETEHVQVENIDPVVARFNSAKKEVLDGEFFQTPLDRLFDTLPLESSTAAPFAFALPGETPFPR